MGQDKALLPIQGVPLLLVLAILKHCLIRSMLTPWPERYQDTCYRRVASSSGKCLWVKVQAMSPRRPVKLLPLDR